MNGDEIIEILKEMRGIETLCSNCGGWGVKVYGSTSTWRGGVGGQMITSGVCDKCWGSGDADTPWPSHRQFHNMKEKIKKYEQY